MRPFRIEYRALAGFHDGVRARVADTSLSTPLVSLHEATHARILHTTPDGHVLTAYCRALDSGLIPAAAVRAVEASTAIFGESSLVPHEVFATYLSVKAMPAAQEDSLLAQLTPEYRQYFQALAVIVDPVFRSSQLQFLVAWNCAVVVFSSPLIERFPLVDITQPIQLSDAEDAGKRFDALLAALRRVGPGSVMPTLEGVAREACRRNGLHPWDIQSEDAWLAATKTDGGYTYEPAAIEEALSEALREWLASIAPFQTLLGSKLLRALETFSRAVRDTLPSSVLDTLPSSVLSGPLERSPKESLAECLEREALDHGDSRVVNTSVYQLRTLKGESTLWSRLLDGASSIAIFSGSPPTLNMSHWSIFTWPTATAGDPEAAPGFFAAFERQDVISFLHAWIERKDSRRDAPRIRAIAIAVQDPMQLVLCLQNVDYLLWRREEFVEKLCWYWSGNLHPLYAMFGAQKERLLTGRLKTSPELNSDEPTMAWNDGRLILHLLHVGEELGTGLFMRAFPLTASASVNAFERILIDDGGLHEMPLDMLERFAPLAKDALYAAQSLWPEY